MKILALSDVELPAVYSSRIRERFQQTDLVISCGDLPYYYLEYVLSSLDIPLYYVHGNHVTEVAQAGGETRAEPWGGVNLHRKVVYDRKLDLVLAGIEGSVRYSKKAHQYSQARMWWMVLGLVPGLLLNKLLHGRYLDILVTHSAPEGIQDDKDLPHRGIQAFRWLIRTFKPRLALHGHVHLYTPIIPWKTQFKETLVVNAYGYREIPWPLPENW
ncbi:MAG TPA: hypothetical protein PKL60_04025 [Anaerolineaceae bacterium]|nr:hypothetical protein [Anaerolineaceae bacterium]